VLASPNTGFIRTEQDKKNASQSESGEKVTSLLFNDLAVIRFSYINHKTVIIKWKSLTGIESEINNNPIFLN
jgi:hypothetical protein